MAVSRMHIKNTQCNPYYTGTGLSLWTSEQDVRAHNSTPPWTTLAASSGENPVSVMCSCVSLSQRHGTVIPRRDPRFTSASPECFHVDAGHTVHTTHHAGRSSVPGGCCSSVECSPAVCSLCVITAAVPLRHEDGTVPVIILCLVKCHLNLYIDITLHCYGIDTTFHRTRI